MNVLEFPKAPKLHPRIEAMMQRGLLFDAFLKQEGIRLDQTLSTVMISFPSKVAADEFRRLLRAGMRSYAIEN